jgi:hypothetical protein
VHVLLFVTTDIDGKREVAWRRTISTEVFEEPGILMPRRRREMMA